MDVLILLFVIVTSVATLGTLAGVLPSTPAVRIKDHKISIQ